MNSATSFSLEVSGQPFLVPNGLVDSSSIGVAYTVAGAPATLAISIEGVKKATGDVAVLDTYSGTTNTTRTVNLTDTYDYFRFIATWKGGTNVSVFSSLTSTGPGPTWSSASLTAFQNRPF